jgi:hypothetical protein
MSASLSLRHQTDSADFTSLSSQRGSIARAVAAWSRDVADLVARTAHGRRERSNAGSGAPARAAAPP